MATSTTVRADAQTGQRKERLGGFEASVNWDGGSEEAVEHLLAHARYF